MLFVSGFGALGAVMPELVTLKNEVDRCIRNFPINTSTNAGANLALNCHTKVMGALDPRQGLPQFEKQTLLEPEDNAALFEIARTILTQWRNTGIVGGEADESELRRIAAVKLGESAVFDAVSPTLAAQALSSAGRIEPGNPAKLAIVRSLHRILKTRDIPDSVRVEATTTLKILADPNTHPIIDVNVLNAARDALRDLGLTLEIGPVTITEVKKPRSKFFVPLVAMGVTAAVATGVLIWFARRPPAETLGMGPLRRKVEAARRQRR